MSKSVFIGSSLEGLSFAEKLKSELAEFDCHLWNENIFHPNDATFETLLIEARLCDFAIVVFSKDDNANVRNNQVELPRDNALLEFGLFLGCLGKERSIVVAERDVHIPSDLLGISQVFVSRTQKGQPKLRDIKNASQSIRDQFKLAERNSVSKWSPSTTLARMYFMAFVRPMANFISNHVGTQIPDLNNYLVNQLVIQIPQELAANTSQAMLLNFRQNGYVEETLHIDNSLFKIWTKQYYNTKYLIDSPQCLDCLKESIDIYTQGIGANNEERKQRARRQALDQFLSVLRYLVDDDAIVKQFVRIM